ncbi:MAG: DUF6391 domain-containing protein [Kofleriaceae bacterium]
MASARLYAALSWWLFRQLSANRWILTIVRDPATRIAHGLEHATLAVLSQDGLPAVRGFTHGRDRFVIALEAGNEHQLTAVREAAASSIRRIRGGERSLAYQPGCGTSEVVSAVSLWLVVVTSMVFSLVVGGSAAIFLAVSVIVFRFWLAFETALGLLAQRLFTVSTEFASARVVDVREVLKVRGMARPQDETWFEFVVDVRIASSEGGLVSPGGLA